MLASTRRDCCMRSPYTTFHRFQSTACQPKTHVNHVALTRMYLCCSALPSHCPKVSLIPISLSPDFDVLNQQRVVVMIKFIRMLSGNVIVNVFKSDVVIWWAAIFRTPSSMFDKLLHLSKSQSSGMSRLRCHDLREAMSDLLTVSMHLQDSLFRFHRPSLHKIDLRVHVASALARTLVSRIPELLNCPCTAQSFQASSCTFCSIGLSVRYPSKLHQPVPSTRTHQNSDKPCSVSWKTHTGDTTCFQQNP